MIFLCILIILTAPSALSLNSSDYSEISVYFPCRLVLRTCPQPRGKAARSWARSILPCVQARASHLPSTSRQSRSVVGALAFRRLLQVNLHRRLNAHFACTQKGHRNATAFQANMHLFSLTNRTRFLSQSLYQAKYSIYRYTPYPAPQSYQNP